MKIGILTFHFGKNYGGVLQCYGLQQYLISCGHDVKVINYIPNESTSKSKWKVFFRKVLNAFNFKRMVLWFTFGKKQDAIFKNFRDDYLNQTFLMDYSKLSSLTNEFEAIIVGSDQIWNPSQHYKGSYFLTHLESFKGRRISYAPCCAVNKVMDRDSDNLRKSLDKFDSVSVRNKVTSDFVSRFLHEKPKIVLDPVFLWEYDQVISDGRLIEEEYVLVYVLGSEINGGNSKAVEMLKRRFVDHRIIAITLSQQKVKSLIWADDIISFATPFEWINLIKYADFVYTDSFHGLVFSVKYRKPFIAYYSEELRASRFLDLCERYGVIQQCVFSHSNDIDEDHIKNIEKISTTIIDYFQEDIVFSKEFLLQALN